jgi:hypothetical protein
LRHGISPFRFLRLVRSGGSLDMISAAPAWFFIRHGRLWAVTPVSPDYSTF